MTTTAALLINGTDVTGSTEWDCTWEERADGSPGTLTATIQDRTNTALYGVTKRDHCRLQLSTGFVLWDGEITGATLDLPVGMPWGRWKITASDWNTIPDLRLVGVPNGGTWLSIDGGVTFQVVDPSASNGSTDATTVAQLFGAYVSAPGGVTAFNTTAYVGTYIANSLLNFPVTGDPVLTWPTHTTLKQSLDDLRSMAGTAIYMWIDPEGYVHWQVFPDPVLVSGGALVPFTDGLLSTMLPQSIGSLSGSAPAALVDSSPNPFGTPPTIGCRALSFTFDGTYMPEQAYIVGDTDYLYNGGAVIAQGTGWGAAAFDVADTSKRQVAIEARATSVADRIAVAAAMTKYAKRARIKISATHGGRLDEGPVIDGWRCGQTVTITDARLPAGLNGLAWPIQRVSGKLVKGRSETRLYTVEAGDAPIGSFFRKFRQEPKARDLTKTAKKPAYSWEIYFQQVSGLGLAQAQTLVLQLVDSAKKPLQANGIPGSLTLTVTDSTGATVTSDASLSPTSVSSNSDGQATTLFTTDSTQAGLSYKVACDTPPQ